MATAGRASGADATLSRDWVDCVRDLLRQDPGKAPVDVFILTFCRHPELFYGTSLVFKTLRDGFPSSRVFVVDNASVPGQRSEIRALAASRGCRFVQIASPGIEHHEFLETVTRLSAESGDGNRPLVFLDPDVCLWETCESLRFEGLVAGKLVTAFQCGVTESLTMPRLHSSFLWIPSPSALVDAIDRERRVHIDFEPFRPYSVKIAGRWCRFDTGASLLAAFPDRVSCFGDAELDRYDHIFSGTHAHVVFRGLEPGLAALLAGVHEAARNGDLEALRGVWRTQDAAFRAMSTAV